MDPAPAGLNFRLARPRAVSHTLRMTEPLPQTPDDDTRDRGADALALATERLETMLRAECAHLLRIGREATAPDALLGAACEYTQQLRTSGATAAQIVMQLKALIERACYPAPAGSGARARRLTEHVVSTCIKEYYRP